MSHTEKGWSNEVDKKGIISYLKYGFDLNL